MSYQYLYVFNEEFVVRVGVSGVKRSKLINENKMYLKMMVDMLYSKKKLINYESLVCS
jgi:hypothetical protein